MNSSSTITIFHPDSRPNMSPQVKFEDSPAESFISTPSTKYSSLFDTMDPTEAMSPHSCEDESMFGSVSGTPAPESQPREDKKPTKKRKSWGQILPEPKTNLPPRYVDRCSWQTHLTAPGNEQRPKTRRNNEESSESFEIVEQLKHLENASDKKSKPSRQRSKRS